MIIKNCPACRDYDVFGKDNEGCCYLYNDYCIKNNDCLLKQIVNMCKKEKPYKNINRYEYQNGVELEITIGHIDNKNAYKLAKQILDLLEIEV